MAKQLTPPFTSFLALKYWPTWFGMLLLWIIAHLPFFFRINIGTGLGLLTYYIAKERRYITEVNINLCFPQLSFNEQQQLCRSSFIENGIGLIETVTGWSRDPEYFRPHVTMVGDEKVRAALAEGKGAILVGAHFSTLDLGGTLLSLFIPFSPTYRPHNNGLFNAFMLKGRSRFCEPIDRNDIRGIFKRLKKGQAIWYAPDQDYHRLEHAVQAPFFGQMASTINTTSRLAKVNNSPVFILRHHRLGRKNHYHFELTEITEEFPSNDLFKDVSLINSKLETAIKHFPSQYLWMHKRFKTQLEGKPQSPYINIKTSCKTITVQQYESIIIDAKSIRKNQNYGKVIQLDNGLQLTTFSGDIKKISLKMHPALHFDHLSKLLRIKKIPCITVDNIFNVPDLNLTALTFFPLKGEAITANTFIKDSSTLTQLAKFLANFHQAGFRFKLLTTESIIHYSTEFSILHPENVKDLPFSASYLDRCFDISRLLKLLAFDTLKAQQFREAYCLSSNLNNNVNFKEILNQI